MQASGAYVTHNATWPTKWNQSIAQFIRLDAAFSGATKGVILPFFPYAVVLSETYKYILMCEIGGVQASQHQPVEVKLIRSKLDSVYSKKNLWKHKTVLIFIHSTKLAK